MKNLGRKLGIAVAVMALTIFVSTAQTIMPVPDCYPCEGGEVPKRECWTIDWVCVTPYWCIPIPVPVPCE